MNRRKPRLDPFKRNVVLHHGNINLRPFIERRLEPAKFNEKEFNTQFRFARELVVTVPIGKFREIARYFKSFFPRWEEHGLLVAVIVDDKDYKQVLKIRDSDPNSSARIYYRKDLFYAADDIAREYISPKQENEAVIDCSEDLGEEKKLLLRRAFFDCVK